MRLLTEGGNILALLFTWGTALSIFADFILLSCLIFLSAFFLYRIVGLFRMPKEKDKKGIVQSLCIMLAGISLSLTFLLVPNVPPPLLTYVPQAVPVESYWECTGSKAMQDSADGTISLGSFDAVPLKEGGDCAWTGNWRIMLGGKPSFVSKDSIYTMWLSNGKTTFYTSAVTKDNIDSKFNEIISHVDDYNNTLKGIENIPDKKARKKAYREFDYPTDYFGKSSNLALAK